MGGVQRSTLQGRFGRLNDLAGGGDPWSGLRRQFKLKLLYEEPLVAIGFCVAAEDQHAPIGSREVNVEHLDAARRLYRFATLVTGCLSSLMAENQDAGISGGLGLAHMRPLTFGPQSLITPLTLVLMLLRPTAS
jgi:hypothetical protein